MKPVITLSQAMADQQLLGGPFQSPTFWTWKTVAKLIDGLPLTEPRELELFRESPGARRCRLSRCAVRFY
jgi:hypothetical protein